MPAQPSEKGKFHDRHGEGRPKLDRVPKPIDGDPARPVWVDDSISALLAAERRVRSGPKKARGS